MYVKEKYLKMALKGIIIPFAERWESALVGMQALYAINANVQRSAAKLLESIPDEFNNKFSDGTPIDYTDMNRKWLTLYLRVQNLMRTTSNYVSRTAPGLDEIIISNRTKIDEGIFKYFVGNKQVLLSFRDEIKTTVDQIDNSIKVCFHNNIADVETIKMGLQETFGQTREDLQRFNEKIAKSLKLEDVMNK